MSSIVTPMDAHLSGLQTQAQPQGQMFESLKKQLEASSFDRLFQSGYGEQGSPFKVFSHASVCAQHMEGRTLESNRVPDVAPAPISDDQKFDLVQPSKFPSSTLGLNLAQVENQRGEMLMGLQDVRRFPSAVGDSDGESVTRPLDARALVPATDTVDIAAEAVVVGAEGERVRIWMRSGGKGFSQEQLISRIRAELSWAGMALETFVFNGKKLVGIK